MDYKTMEQNIFADGFIIEFEYINNLGVKIRCGKTIAGKEYRMIYTRNKNNVFVIHSIKEVE